MDGARHPQGTNVRLGRADAGHPGRCRNHRGDDGGGSPPPGGQISFEHPGAINRDERGSRSQQSGQYDAQHRTDQAGYRGFDGGYPRDHVRRCADEPQGREAFPAPGRTEAGDDADEQQNREEDRNGTDEQHGAVGGRAASVRGGSEPGNEGRPSALAEFGFRGAGDNDQGIRTGQGSLVDRAGEFPETIAKLVPGCRLDQMLEGRRCVIPARLRRAADPRNSYGGRDQGRDIPAVDQLVAEDFHRVGRHEDRVRGQRYGCCRS
ncbi:hypothetical protein D9M72_440660 [compost metagenome]